MKKVFIIEDNVYDYINLTSILNSYDVAYYPIFPEKNIYAKVFSRWAINQHSKDYELIKEAIDKIKPDYILLDIGLSADQLPDDHTGDLLKEKLLDIYFPNIPVKKITARYPVSDDCILKGGDYSLEDELYNKFLGPEKIDRIPSDNSALNGGTLLEPDTNSNVTSSINQTQQPYQLTKKDMAEQSRYAESIYFTNLKEWVSRKCLPIITYILHIIITIVFYALIVFLFFLGCKEIIHANDGYHNILEIAETTFVAFLPLLIIFGFFIFYWASLRPFLFGDIATDTDMETPSRLISYTKKLFISSLISYLFTKSIELLFLDSHGPALSGRTDFISKPDSINKSDLINKPDLINNKFLDYHNTNHPYAQLLAIGVIIIFLTLYYIYLNSHTTSPKEKHPKQ